MSADLEHEGGDDEVAYDPLLVRRRQQAVRHLLALEEDEPVEAGAEHHQKEDIGQTAARAYQQVHLERRRSSGRRAHCSCPKSSTNQNDKEKKIYV